MEKASHYDIASWWTHITDEDCALIVRTNNGFLFYCHLDPKRFCQSPEVTEQYFKCLDMLRSGQEEKDDFYLEDACDWLLQPFEPLINQLAPATISLPVLTASGRPTLSQYLFPRPVFFILDAKDNQLQPIQVEDSREYAWRDSRLKLDDKFAKDLDQWTKTFHPSSIEVCYDDPRYVLIKPPTKVIVLEPGGQPVTCFFKPFSPSSRNAHTDIELDTHKKIVKARISPPHVQICRIYGLVGDESGLLGMLFPWIDKREVMSKWLVEESPSDLRRRWASQIEASVKKLHQEGIIWGDVKGDNVLIDKNDDAWVIDFGGSYTPGWVDPDKAGTLEGDEQGLRKIMDMLL
ncbi:Serine threonine protein kinase [Fusarium austroafricanum]|uniref:Serine threonine protein kinase n=1 Tax=Fusarium austroafricanum TaxID=2364996 RepID=A0A8H4KRC2_9HYPO|nr:Serine threonine protein kinase [Fusarium austroafricanum]